jgi:hypothetical protein
LKSVLGCNVFEGLAIRVRVFSSRQPNNVDRQIGLIYGCRAAGGPAVTQGVTALSHAVFDANSSEARLLDVPSGLELLEHHVHHVAGDGSHHGKDEEGVTRNNVGTIRKSRRSAYRATGYRSSQTTSS